MPRLDRRELHRIEGGNAEIDARLELRDRVERVLRRGPAFEINRRRAGPEREGDRIPQPVGEEHLGRREQHVVRRHPRDGLGVEDRGVDLVLVLMDRCLGIAGRARRVEPETVGPGCRGLGRAPGIGGGQQRLVREPAGRLRIDADAVADGFARLGQRRLHLAEHVGMSHRRAGARIPQHVGVIRRPQEIVDRDRHRADPRRAEEAIVEPGSVLAEQHDAVALPDAELPEGVRGPVYPFRDPSEAPRGAAGDQKRLVAPTFIQVAVEERDRDVEGRGETNAPWRARCIDDDAVIAHAPLPPEIIETRGETRQAGPVSLRGGGPAPPAAPFRGRRYPRGTSPEGA